MVHACKYVICVSCSRAGDMGHTESSRCRAAHISPTNNTSSYVVHVLFFCGRNLGN